MPSQTKLARKATTRDPFFSASLKRKHPMYVVPVQTLLAPSFGHFRSHEELMEAGEVVEVERIDVRVDGLRGGLERDGARGGAHAGRAVVVRMRRLSHPPVDQHRRRGQRPSFPA